MKDHQEDSFKIAQYLTRNAGLTDADLQKIMAYQNAKNVRFSEAAIALSLATADDIEQAMTVTTATRRVQTTGALPDWPIARDPFHPDSEKVRALRTEITLRQAGSASSNVFAVVSPHQREGRSRLAAELAISFAQLQQPTLLIDADLRQPMQHQYFRLDSERGLSNAITTLEMPKIHQLNELPALAVLVAGAVPRNPLELLSSPIFFDMISGWRRRYRHIILDTPPASRFSDAFAVATYGGQILPVARLHNTPLADLKTMMQRMVATQAKVLGGVLLDY
jgi:capsular exopolysaccharide synthesis family protein